MLDRFHRCPGSKVPRPAAWATDAVPKIFAVLVLPLPVHRQHRVARWPGNSGTAPALPHPVPDATSGEHLAKGITTVISAGRARGQRYHAGPARLRRRQTRGGEHTDSMLPIGCRVASYTAGHNAHRNYILTM